MSTIAVAGNPYEQGLSHGRQLDGDIHINLDLIRAYLAEKHCDPQMVERVNAANLEFLTAHCPEVVEEYQALAVGCGLELREVALINTPVYFLHDYLQQGCSMLLAKAPATADGYTYLIKNRDIGLPLRQCVISRDYGRGNKIIEQNSAGIITMPGIGINNAGLAIATTGCWPKYQQMDFALAASHYLQVNIHLLMRNCQTVRQVIAYLHHLPRMTGMNLIAADATGEAAVIEIAADRFCYTFDDGAGILYHTNHYLSEQLSQRNDPEYVSTYKRFQRIGELVTQRPGRLRFQDMIKIMSDHRHGENSICRHGSEENSSNTVCSSILSLENQEMWVTFGHPCQGWPNMAI